MLRERLILAAVVVVAAATSGCASTPDLKDRTVAVDLREANTDYGTMVVVEEVQTWAEEGGVRSVDVWRGKREGEPTATHVVKVKRVSTEGYLVAKTVTVDLEVGGERLARSWVQPSGGLCALVGGFVVGICLMPCVGPGWFLYNYDDLGMAIVFAPALCVMYSAVAPALAAEVAFEHVSYYELELTLGTAVRGVLNDAAAAEQAERAAVKTNLPPSRPFRDPASSVRPQSY